MACVLVHLFAGGSQAYVEPTDDLMVRRAAEILARNIGEIDDPTVIEEIAACLEEPASIESAETAIGLYCEAVPLEGFTLSIAHETNAKGGHEPPPLAESLAVIRRHLRDFEEDDGLDEADGAP